MWPTSSRWAATIVGTAVIELKVEAWRGGLRLSPPEGLPVEPSNARITADGGSQVRRTCSLTIADPSLRPVYWTDMLSPAGTELVITSGVRYPDGTTELVPVGVFRIDQPDTPFGDVITVTGSDRSIVLVDDKFLTPQQSQTTNSIPQEIERLIKYSLPTAVVTDLTGNFTDCPKMTWEQDTSPWAAIDELATSIGAEVAPNAEGVFVIRRQPKPSDPPVWTAAVGESGIIVGGLERMTRDNVFNGWIARNDAADGSKPIQAIVLDTAGGSPTNWHGAFGHRPRVYSSASLTSVSKCITAAQTLLERSIAPARAVTAQVIPNPAVDYGDVAEVVLPDGTVEVHMVQGFTLPLGVDDAMTVQFVSSLPAA
jgi:hypothetical protein